MADLRRVYYSGSWFTKDGKQRLCSISTDYNKVKDDLIRKMKIQNSHGIIMKGQTLYKKLPNPTTGRYPRWTNPIPFMVKLSVASKMIPIGNFKTFEEAEHHLTTTKFKLEKEQINTKIFGNITKNNVVVHELQ